MLKQMVRVGVLAALLAGVLFGVVGLPKAYAGSGSASIVEDVVQEADISGVIDLVQQALTNHQGLSIEDQDVIYSALGRTNRAIDRLYNTGATGDVFKAAETLLLTQMDLLHEIEAASLSENLDDLNDVVVMLVDFAQAKLAFDRQMALANGEPLSSLTTHHNVSAVDIARDDSATRAALAHVLTALATGRPVDLDISGEVYRALGETSRGLDLIHETGETGDVFNAAQRLLEHRFQLLTDLEQATISGSLDDLRAVAEDWVEVSKEQLVFERQLAARDTQRQSHSFLQRRGNRFFNSLRRHSSIDHGTSARLNVHAGTTQLYTVQPGDTLSSIASRFGASVERIAQLNNISNPRLIRTGMRLVIPATP